MRIAVFTNAYHPIVSGVVNAVDGMEQGLTARGHQVCIVAPRYPGYEEPRSSVIRFPSVRLTSRADFPLPFPYAPKLIRQIEEWRPDVIHAQHPFLLGVLGQRLARKHKIALVFTFHTLYEHYAHYAPAVFPRALVRWAVRRMVSSFVKKSDAVIVPSPSVLAAARRYGGGQKLHVIPNAVNLNAFENSSGKAVRQKYRLQEKKVMIFVGRLAEEKNLPFLIRSYAKILPRVPEAVLMLVGDGPCRPELEEEAAGVNRKGRVIFTGMIPYAEIAAYYKAADLFVTGSKTEVKPLCLLEAMACGLPVLAVKASGAVDTVTDDVDGYLTHENEEEFAAACVRLLTDADKLRSLRTNAKKTALSFGIPAMAEKLEKLYLSLCSRRLSNNGI